MATAGKWEEVKPALSPSVLKVLTQVLNFPRMTPVQAHTLPKFLSHKDVAVEAPTGSGKTLAFVVPIFEILLRRKEPLKEHEVGAIIITPTRELAVQIEKVIVPFSKETNLRSLLLIGGRDEEEDVRRWHEAGGAIVVATPGRLDHFMKTVPDFRVRELEVLVLDEADRLLDMGFEATLNNILTRLPKQRRTVPYSTPLPVTDESTQK